MDVADQRRAAVIGTEPALLVLVNLLVRFALIVMALSMAFDARKAERQFPLMVHVRRIFTGAVISGTVLLLAALERLIDFLPGIDLYMLTISDGLLLVWLPTLVPAVRFWWVLHWSGDDDGGKWRRR